MKLDYQVINIFLNFHKRPVLLDFRNSKSLFYNVPFVVFFKSFVN